MDALVLVKTRQKGGVLPRSVMLCVFVWRITNSEPHVKVVPKNYSAVSSGLRTPSEWLQFRLNLRNQTVSLDDWQTLREAAVISISTFL